MKAIFFLIFTLIVGAAYAQPNIPFSLLNYQQFGKSVVASGQRPLDAKYKYYDAANFITRAYKDTTEVRLVLPLNQRDQGLTVLVNSGGTLLNGVITGGTNIEWWYKDGKTDADLVIKTVSNIYGINGSIPASTNRIVTIPDGSYLSFNQARTGMNFSHRIGYSAADAFIEKSVLTSTTSNDSTFWGGKTQGFTRRFEAKTQSSNTNALLNITAATAFLQATLSSGPTGQIGVSNTGSVSLAADSAGTSSKLDLYGSRVAIASSGPLYINGVLGTTGQYITNVGGVLGWGTPPGGGSGGLNFYNGDSTLAGNRIVYGGGRNLTFGDGIGSNIGAFTVNSGSFQFNGNGGTTIFGNSSGNLLIQADVIRLVPATQLKIINLPTINDSTPNLIGLLTDGTVFKTNMVSITNNLTTKGYVDSLTKWHHTDITGAGTTVLTAWPLNQVDIRTSSTITGTIQVDMPNHPPHGTIVLVHFENTTNTTAGLVANTVTFRATGSDQILKGTFNTLYSNESIKLFYNEPTFTWKNSY